MKKGTKKFTAFMLALLLSLSCIPATVRAEDASGITQRTVSDTRTEDSVAEVTAGGAVRYYTDLTEALNAVKYGGTLQLLKDAGLTGNVDFLDRSGVGIIIHIYLNGHTVQIGTYRLCLEAQLCNVYGPGTFVGNLEIIVAYLNGPLTVKGNVTGSGADSLKVSGGRLEVYGNISGFTHINAYGAEVYCAGNMELSSEPLNRGTIVNGIWLDSLQANGLGVENLDRTGNSTVNLGTVSSHTLVLNAGVGDYFSGAAVSLAGGNGTLVSGTAGQDLQVPLNPGENLLTLTVSKDGKTGSYPLHVTFQKQESGVQITGNLDREYDGNPVAAPQYSVTGSQGAVSVIWYEKQADGSWKERTEAPVNAGLYKVEIRVAEDADYNGASAETEFVIRKTLPVYTLPTGLVIAQGRPLSSLDLSGTGFQWLDGTQTAEELGTHVFKALFTPEDTVNYQSVEVEIPVTVLPVPVALNHVPEIRAEDRTLTAGDDFDPRKDVTAYDEEDGDVTEEIQITENTVDTKKAGTYQVTYQVSDSKGATAVKTITVTVQAKSQAEKPSGTPDTSGTDKNSSSTDGKTGTGVQTGDGSHVLLWGMTAAVSALAVLASISARRRKQR